MAKGHTIKLMMATGNSKQATEHQAQALEVGCLAAKAYLPTPALAFAAGGNQRHACVDAAPDCVKVMEPSLRTAHLCCSVASGVQDYLEACQGADIIISMTLCLYPTYCIARHLGVAWVPVLLAADFPTGDYPSWLLGSMPFSFRWLNKASHK
jgi:hypothetical protein